MTSSAPAESQQKPSNVDTMALIQELYQKRHLMPMQAEPGEIMKETQADGDTTTQP